MKSIPKFNGKMNWINGLGLAFIFTAFLYFLKIAADAGWLPPELRSAIGLLLGAGAIFAGIQLNNQGKGVWGESIAGLGTAVVYATLAYVSFTGLFHFSANSLLISMLSIGVLTACFDPFKSKDYKQLGTACAVNQILFVRNLNVDQKMVVGLPLSPCKRRE